jgi:hypothetical protein
MLSGFIIVTLVPVMGGLEMMMRRGLMVGGGLLMMFAGRMLCHR